MTIDKDVTVVVGFKDWGLRRVLLAVKSIMGSFGDLDGEVIVSDYGSRDTEGVGEAVEKLGGRYVYTQTDGVWSRTRALNAGFAVSTGRVLVATDADMVFSPRSFEIIGRHVLDHPQTALLLQCRDLPPGRSDLDIEESGLDWTAFEREGRRRPRWGMGGMMAVSRATFLQVRGYDERMHTYGGEDIDFANRIRRAGSRLVWVEHPDVRMYHMWHPSTADKHAMSVGESAAVEANKSIMREDKTFVRNVTAWTHRPPDARPLVSVVISTYNRAHLLHDTVYSVQAQTVQDFELVIVDDGSTDDTAEVVARLQLDDSRIRYVHQENQGVAAARNRGVDESRGHYVAVLDDDDIALPWRLEAQFSVLTEGVSATFGAFANFDDDSGQLTLHRTKQFTLETTADKGGAPGHSTWMVERELMAAIRYDEDLTSGIDNNFALRSLRSGLRWRHSGQVHTLRRVHAQQITAQDSAQQLGAARGAYDYLTFTMQPWTRDKLRKERTSADYVPITRFQDEELIPFLPDHLVRRGLTTIVDASPHQDTHFRCRLPDGSLLHVASTDDLTWKDLAQYRGQVSLSAIIATRQLGAPTPPLPRQDLRQVLEVLRDRTGASGTAPGIIVAELLIQGDPSVEAREGLGEHSTQAHVSRGDQTWTWFALALDQGPDTAAALDRWSRFGTVRVVAPTENIRALTQTLLSLDTKDGAP